MVVFGECAQVEAVELLNDGSGLAFGIVGGRSSGVVVKSILPGGVADRDGRLRSGDRLLRIGCVSVVGMCARQAAAVLRQCGACVRLLVARPADAAASQSLGASPAPIVPSRLLGDPLELERYLAGQGYEGFGDTDDDITDAVPEPTLIEERHLMRPVASIVAVVPRGALRAASTPLPPIITTSAPAPAPLRLPLDMAIRGEPETLSYSAELSKDASLGLGITVAGYVCEQEELSGIFVKSISKSSSAYLSGKIRVNDRIVEVDGISLNGVSNHKAVALLRDARGATVRLRMLRYLRGARYERLQRALAQDDRRSPLPPPSPSATSLPNYSFSVYDESSVIETDPDWEARHPASPASPSDEQEIVLGADAASERADARTIQDKWRELLAAETDWPGHSDPYDIIVGTIMKEKETGLGISLCGTVRVIAGREVQARHYIRAVAPHGPLAAAGLYRVGDELLEVNGWRVLGVHHVEVVSRLRSVLAPVQLVCARRRGAAAQVIDTAQHCTAFHARNILGGSLQNLLMPPQRLIKAKSESSVASLCSANTVLSAAARDEFSADLDRNKSRSLEPLSGLAMWSDHPEFIELQKEDRGLGFSILDYLDPSEPGRSVIVVRSVVSGGAAAADGRLAAGDRLLSVNGEDVSRAPLALAVRAIKSAPKGLVTIGVAKPLPCSAIVGGDNGNSLSSQECINSLGSDEHTGFDSFHECLQEYQEGLEVVQICLEPEDPSIKDDEVSAFEDLSMEECRNKTKSGKNTFDNGKFNILKERVGDNETDRLNGAYVNINGNMKSSKSDESLEDHDDDMTITEDDPEETPRDLPNKQHYVDLRSRSADRKHAHIKYERAPLSQQQSKDISTSDEMVFAVTPTGLERISFERYWKEDQAAECEEKKTLEKIKSDESWKDCLNSPPSETPSYCDATAKLSVQDSNSLLFIDHECDGYETCLDDDSNSVKVVDKSKELKIMNEKDNIVNTHANKYDRASSAEQLKSDDEVSAKSISKDANVSDDAVSYENYPYVQEHIIKQMKSLRIEPLNVNITNKKFKKRSPNKVKGHKSHRKQHCVEYYNDQAECLEEYKRQKKLEEEERQNKEEQKKLLQSNRITLAKKLLLKNQEPSEDSTDQETGYVPGCHKCFLENYAYAITKAYIAKANACKFCEVIREMLEPPKRIPDRSVSAPALLDLDCASISETDEECQLLVPVTKDRRKSAGPLRFLVPSRRQSYAPPPTMTVSVSREPSKESEGPAQRWGTPRKVALRRKSAAGSLGISIVGGKVDIVSNRASDIDDKGIFGIFIKNVVPDSPAGFSGELHTGDRILEVDGTCVRSAPHERAVQLIKAAGEEVILTVQSLQAWTTDTSDVEAERVSTAPSPTPSVVSTSSVKRRAPQPPKSPVAPEPSKSPASSPLPPRTPSPSPQLPKSPVPSAQPPSPGPSAPQPLVGQPEPSIQDLKTPAVSFDPSVQLLNATPEHEIKITVTADTESPQEDESEKETTPQPESVNKQVYSDDEDSSDEDDDDRRDLEGRTYSEKGLEIDRASAGAIRRSREEKEADKEEEDEFGYTTNKIRKKYAQLGDSVVCVRLERSGRCGLGLSLAGHRDRARMAVFVCGLNPAGGAARAQPPVRVGDEILEVNGIVLHGRCHLNASAIIKGLPGPSFRVILLRRKQALDDVAVKPLTVSQFPVALEEESEDKFAGYRGVRHVSIKKGTASLGIMIIEGRHAEVGQGIFISDIQEGSAAELAGLQIGDLILAVNKDSLLGSGYDAAASLLKRTEGVVVLTVCNPNKKDDSPTEDAAPGKPGSRPTSRNDTSDSSLKPAAGASRPQTPAKPQPSPAKAEPPADPATAPIQPGRNTVIDLNTQNQSPGILLVGGSDTQVTGGAVVLDVYPQGVAGKDGRLQPGDQILESHGVTITKEMSHERICLTIKQKQNKIRMTVFRPDPVQYQDIEVELTRKPGKGLGICAMNRSPPPGSYISDILAGTPADLDGRLQKYDIISAVDGKDLLTANHEDVAVALKGSGPKALVKVKRFKIVR